MIFDEQQVKSIARDRLDFVQRDSPGSPRRGNSRKLDHKGRPAADACTLRANTPAVHLDQCLRDREAESQPAKAMRGTVGLFKGVEDVA